MRDVPPPSGAQYSKGGGKGEGSEDNRGFDRPDLRKAGESTPLMSSQYDRDKSGGTMSPPDEGT